MIITYLGKQFFKVSQGDMTLAFNPISKDSKYSSSVSKFGSNIALSTTNHLDYNGFDMVSHGDNIPFEIKGPGDYEINNIFIKGIMTETKIDNKKYINTVYSLSIDNISICFLGSLTSENGKLDSKVREQIDSPDILFVPIGNLDNLSITNAYKLAVSFEPKIIIPMDYTDKDLKAFLKESGDENVQVVDKLTLKQKDLIGKEGEVVVLSS